MRNVSHWLPRTEGADLSWSQPCGRASLSRTESAIWPILRAGIRLSHVPLTALLIANGDADFGMRMHRRDSLTSAEEDLQAAARADSHDDVTSWAAQAPAPSTHQDGNAGQILISGEELRTPGISVFHQ